MAKTRVQFICQNCGAVHSRWAGKCDSCGEWNTLIEEGTNSGIGSGPGAMLSKRKGRAVALTSLSGEIEDAPRIISGISELDRVTGGGFVRGSALLIGGDPGIGKSTLLTQAAAALSNRGHRIVYVSGEEAVAQIRLRAQRLALPPRQWNLPPKPMSKISSPPFPAIIRAANGPISSLSIRSRHYGPTWLIPRPER